MFRKILVPLDGSELAEQALPYARRLAGTLGRLLLVRASSDDASAADVEDYLDGHANRLQQDGAAAEWHLYYGPPAEAIGHEASLQRADTVIERARLEIEQQIISCLANGIISFHLLQHHSKLLVSIGVHLVKDRNNCSLVENIFIDNGFAPTNARGNGMQYCLYRRTTHHCPGGV